MGWVSPGGHVLPSDHIYFQLISSPTQPVPRVSVVSPGNVTVYEVDSRHYNSTNTNDYSIYFTPCSNVTLFIHHVQTLAPILLSNDSGSKANCVSTNADQGFLSCQNFMDVKLSAGQVIGWAGGSTSSTQAIDFGAYDSRTAALVFANESRYDSNEQHIACPLNYLSQSIQDSLYLRVGLFGIIRTQPPVCGQPDQDVTGTAQGNWFPPGGLQAYTDEGPVIALIHDNLLPNEELFSIGYSANITGVSGGATWYFSPQPSGTVNRDFGNVTAIGQTYCYDSLSSNYQLQGTSIPGIVLLQLTNVNTMRIQYISSGSCGSASFTSGSSTFYR